MAAKESWGWVYHAMKAIERASAAMWLLRHGNLADAIERLGAAITSLTVAIDRADCAKARELLRAARDSLSEDYKQLLDIAWLKLSFPAAAAPEHVERLANQLKKIYDSMGHTVETLVKAIRTACTAKARSLEEFLQSRSPEEEVRQLIWE